MCFCDINKVAEQRDTVPISIFGDFIISFTIFNLLKSSLFSVIESSFSTVPHSVASLKKGLKKTMRHWDHRLENTFPQRFAWRYLYKENDELILRYSCIN